MFRLLYRLANDCVYAQNLTHLSNNKSNRLAHLTGLRIHVAGVPYFDDSRRLRHHRLYLLPVERRRLPMAMDQFPVGGINSHLRVHLFLLLLLLQNKVSVKNLCSILHLTTIFSPFKFTECTDCSKRHSTSVTWHCLAAHLV